MSRSPNLFTIFALLTFLVSVNVFLFIIPPRVNAQSLELFFDDFSRDSNGDTVGNDWEEALANIHNGKEEIKGNPADGYVRLHGEDVENPDHKGHPHAAITHKVDSGGETNPMLSFRWRSAGEFEGPEMLQVVLNEDEENPLWERSLANADGKGWLEEEVELPEEVCTEGAILTFKSTAEANAEIVDIDDVRITCEEKEAEEEKPPLQYERTPAGLHTFQPINFHVKWTDPSAICPADSESMTMWRIRVVDEDNITYWSDAFFANQNEVDWNGFYVTPFPSDLLPQKSYKKVYIRCSGSSDAYPYDGITLEEGNPAFIIGEPFEEENNEAVCTDAKDNDGDGFMDLQDPDCEAFVPKPATITGSKFLDLNRNGIKDEGEIGIPGWRIILENTLGNPMQFSAQITTNASGDFAFSNVFGGHYALSEEQKDGWEQTFPISNFFDVFVELNGAFRVLAGEQEIATPDFGNIETIPPESTIENPEEFDHRMLFDTEIVSLQLRGISVDNFSGIASVDLTVWQVGNASSVENFRSDSFFDVFSEIDCATVIQRQNPPIPPLEKPIPAELVALSLTSSEPHTVAWNHEWSPKENGIWCLEVAASDKAGNKEHSAFAGPVAFGLLAEISQEQTAEHSSDSAIITWTTDRPATSRVIYDTVSHPKLGTSTCPSPLEDLNCYGYAFSTPEQDLVPMVREHSVTITGLSPETTYYYRTVSRASPEQIGQEQSFSTPPRNPSSSSSGTGSRPGDFVRNPQTTFPPSSETQETQEQETTSSLRLPREETSGQKQPAEEPAKELPLSQTKEETAAPEEITVQNKTISQSPKPEFAPSAQNSLLAAIGETMNQIPLQFILLGAAILAGAFYLRHQKTKN